MISIRGWSSSIEVDKIGLWVLFLRSSCVLLHLHLLDANRHVLFALDSIRCIKDHDAIFRKWVVVLCDLIS